ncbi:hypothetical protein [Sulfurospirillum halorespirans]|uniref:Uncharacterized protein n=1 Tax=Sulfurospirillum halorespirans DSM 13726 TaxID=1193502 RepID=A0A1D7TJM3_9BACT|nr:hypothetical protein [Sulfurospirillum halorespirans]AOO65209.1 hypothetical protein SHALO_1434 [Sulfurospirillum halorespirans DSM 13726]
MKKEILYLTEYLAKSDSEQAKAFYELLVQTLVTFELYTPTKFTQAQISALMARQGFGAPSSYDVGVKALDAALEQTLPIPLQEAKKSLFMTLLTVNFPKKKSFLSVSLELFLSQLEPVEKSIYENLLAYVSGLNRALALFFVLGKEEASIFTPERLVAFGDALHVKLVELVFNEEEKALLSQGLKELLGVYLSLYGKYLYI